jgi:glycosyltransferase involved in cell wall biosynthesis
MARTRPTILFVAMSGSIHTARWINQLEGQGWDLHLFPSLDQGAVHPDLRSTRVHHSVYGKRPGPPVRAPQSGINVRSHELAWVMRRYLELRHPTYRARQLARVIARLKPDIVHSLEMQAGGVLTLQAKQRLNGAFPKWIATNWGSDISLFGRLSEHRERIGQILAECNYYGCECERDVRLAREHGLQASTLPVMPNGGGFDLAAAGRLRSTELPSRRRVILVKGYQTWAGRALVALRAIARCADLARGYEVIVHSATGDVKLAAQLLAADTGITVKVLPPDLTHEDMLRHYGSARVAIGLSIGDGISTSMLEAMLMGAFPIQSDTACCTEWFEEGRSGRTVPAEDVEVVERAVREALTDDELVDRAMERNWAVATERLDAAKLRPRAIGIYEKVLKELSANG